MSNALEVLVSHRNMKAHITKTFHFLEILVTFPFEKTGGLKQPGKENRTTSNLSVKNSKLV